MEPPGQFNAPPFTRADSRYSFYGAANGGAHAERAATTKGASIGSRMPKNFTKPLTCFYWDNGHCNKSDDQCLYAHYHTGLVAAAPVSVSGSRGPVAGRNAIDELNHQLEREKQLQDWEAMLKAKEMALNGRRGALQAPYHTEASLGRVHEVIAKGKASASKAHVALTLSLERASNTVTIHGAGACAVVLKAIEEAAASVSSFTAELEQLQEQMEQNSAKSLGLSQMNGAS